MSEFLLKMGDIYMTLQYKVITYYITLRGDETLHVTFGPILLGGGGWFSLFNFTENTPD
jgi:hypothetical protein